MALLRCPAEQRYQPNQCRLRATTAASRPVPSSQRQFQAEEPGLQSVVYPVSFLGFCSSGDHPADFARGLAALGLKCPASILRSAGSLEQEEILGTSGNNPRLRISQCFLGGPGSGGYSKVQCGKRILWSNESVKLG